MTEITIAVRVTPKFLYKVLKKYTRKLEDFENRKIGIRKNKITKEIVCDKIIEDMEKAGLI